MKIEDIRTISLGLLGRFLKLLSEHRGLMGPRFMRIQFRREFQPALFPMRIGSERFLLSVIVNARSVDFVVPLRLQVVGFCLYPTSKVRDEHCIMISKVEFYYYHGLDKFEYKNEDLFFHVMVLSHHDP